MLMEPQVLRARQLILPQIRGRVKTSRGAKPTSIPSSVPTSYNRESVHETGSTQKGKQRAQQPVNTGRGPGNLTQRGTKQDHPWLLLLLLPCATTMVAAITMLLLPLSLPPRLLRPLLELCGCINLAPRRPEHSHLTRPWYTIRPTDGQSSTYA